MNKQLAMISIGKVIREALAFDPKNWGKGEFNADSIPDVVSDLLVLLDERKINYVLTGGIALLSYIKGRNTSDLDLMLTESALQGAPEITLIEAEDHLGQGDYHGLRLNFLFTEAPLYDLVSREYAQTRNFLERPLKTATVEGLLLLKLSAYPSLQKQGVLTLVEASENAITSLIREYSPDEKHLLEVLSKHMSKKELVEVGNLLKKCKEG
jgi:hypothetical protein